MFSIIPRFLRDPDGFFRSVQLGEEIRSKISGLALSSAVFLAAYGFVIGLSHSLQQALSSAVKMPLLFLATIAFTLPALYFFSLALMGTSLRMTQVMVVLLTGVGVTAFLLLGLTPVTFFFVLTSRNYAFFQVLAVVFVGISGIIGLYYLWHGMILTNLTSEGRPGWGRVLLLGWIFLYAFVSSQMTWRLSPLIGDPSQPFVLIQPSRDNFFIDAINAFQKAIGAPGGSDSFLNAAALACVVPVGLTLLIVGVAIGASIKSKNGQKTTISP
jgi:hypothetical protein